MHQGYRTTVEVLKGYGHQKWGYVCVSRSKVEHTHMKDDAVILHRCARYGFGINIGYGSWATYIDTRGQWYQVMPAITELSVAR